MSVATLWVSREAVNGNPVHETYEAARQAFILSLAKEYGLRPERREQLVDGVYVDYALRGPTGQVAALLKRLARCGMGRFVVDVEDGDEKSVRKLEQANQVVTRELGIEICRV